MPVTFEGRLQIFVKKEFDNHEGTHIEFYEAYFVGTDQNGNDTVLKVNTKQDLTEQFGKKGVAHVSVQEDGKMRLLKFIA